MKAHARPTRSLTRRRLLGGLALGPALLSGARAAPLAPVPPPQSQPLLLRNATLHTVAGPTLTGASLLAERGRIVALAAAGETLPPPSATPQVLDLAGHHVYPGFIGAYTTLGLSEVTAVAATVDTTETGVINPNARAVVAVNADSDLIGVTRAGGVLAALAVPQAGRAGGITGTSALLQLDGWDWAQMALVPELGLHVVLPSLRLHSAVLGPTLQPLAEELRRFTAQRLQQIDEAFVAAGAYARARAADPALPSDMRWEAMRPVMTPGPGQRPVFVQANEVAQIRHALALAERHGLKLVIVGGADAPRLAGLLKQRQVPVVITSVHRLPQRRDDEVDAPFRLAAELHEAGLRFCIARQASGSNSTNERQLPWEAATAVAFGLPREEAIKAITLYPAQILGVDDRLGSLQPGRLASFIVTDGDPLQPTTRIERLFVQGREVSAANRQSQLVERYQARPAR
jgi:imidazolonepropionase-like amidohydrolase